MARSQFWLLSAFIMLFNSLNAQEENWAKVDATDFATANAMATYQEAAEYLAQRVGLRKQRGPTTAALVENYHKTALWFMNAGDYESALTYIDTTLALREITSGVTLTEKARSEHLKGEILNLLENYFLSKTWFDQGLETLKSAMLSGDSTGTNLYRIQYFTIRSASMNTINQDYSKAGLLLRDLQKMNEKGIAGGIPRRMTLQTKLNGHNATAINLQKQKRHEAAHKEYQLALSAEILEHEWTPIQNNVFVLYGNMANNLIEAGEYAEAAKIIDKSIARFKTLEPNNFTNQSLFGSYSFLATLQEAQGNYEDVFKTLEKAKPLAQLTHPSGKGSNLGYLLLRVAQSYADLGEFSKANNYFGQSISALIEDTTGINVSQLPVIRNNVFYAYRDVFIEYLAVRQNAFIQEADAGNPDALPLALETAFKLDSFLNRNRDQLALTASLNRFIEQERRHYAAAIDVALRLYLETDNRQYLEDAYYFASSQKSNLLNRYLNSPDLAQTMGVPQEVIDQQQDLELQVLVLEQRLNTAVETDKASIREALLTANRELDLQRDNIARDYPAFSQALRGYARLDVAAASQILGPDQLVIEYFLSDSSLYVFTIGQDGLNHLVLPRPDSLVQLVAVANTNPEAATLLYQTIVAPAIAQKNGITRLQFIPDGDLWQASFASLRRNDRYLIEDYAISYAYASAMLFADRSGLDVGEGYLGNGISYDDIIRRINASPKRSVVGNQLRNLGPLPFARQEVNEAVAIMGGTERINAKATKTRFLDEAPKAGILHLAMHGIVNDNPMENALVFRGEQDTFDLLTMQEVLARNFPAALTILSACHSGNGPLQQNEGVQSIGRAFMAAGSRSTITSAWEAQDEATYKILTSFYTELDNGVPLDVALQTATKSFLKSETKANRKPENWANLKLHGAVVPFKGKTKWWLWGLGLFVAGSLFLIRRKRNKGGSIA